MADRKHTPDILGEVLGETASPAAMVPVVDQPASRGRARAPRTERPDDPRAPAEEIAWPVAQQPAPTRWVYLIVSFQHHNGWRPRYANGAELADWTAQPEMHDYANQLGREGWELAGASGGLKLYGVADQFQLYFKRPA
jgi:hypothetical protein